MGSERDQTDEELQLLGDFDDMDGLRDNTDVELQLLGVCNDMDGLRDRRRAAATLRLRRYGWAARETRQT